MRKKNKKKITKKLLHKYRLVILNEETFEERVSFKLSRLNVFVVVGISAILLIIMTSVLIAFTPLREYIPGYSSTQLRHQAIALVYKTDSLERVVEQQNNYFAKIQHLLRGEPLVDSSQMQMADTVQVSHISPDSVNLKPSKADSLLRKEVARKEKYNVFSPAVKKSNFTLFPPVKGHITATYDADQGHYAVDIATAENQPVKAVADGMVIFAEWTVQTGNVLIIDHGNGLISIYKHNATLLKQQGDPVKAGEVVALTGNTGELSTGPHLHFELWRNGFPVNPTEFIEFE